MLCFLRHVISKKQDCQNRQDCYIYRVRHVMLFSSWDNKQRKLLKQPRLIFERVGACGTFLLMRFQTKRTVKIAKVGTLFECIFNSRTSYQLKTSESEIKSNSNDFTSFLPTPWFIHREVWSIPLQIWPTHWRQGELRKRENLSFFPPQWCLRRPGCSLNDRDWSWCVAAGRTGQCQSLCARVGQLQMPPPAAAGIYGFWP